MTIKLEIKKIQYDYNRKAAKVSSLSSAKFDKYEHFTGEKILTSDPIRVIEQAKFTDSQLAKCLEKQTKPIEEKGRKQVEAIEEHENN